MGNPNRQKELAEDGYTRDEALLLSGDNKEVKNAITKKVKMIDFPMTTVSDDNMNVLLDRDGKMMGERGEPKSPGMYGPPIEVEAQEKGLIKEGDKHDKAKIESAG